MMHDTSRSYIRDMLQQRLEELTMRMGKAVVDDVQTFTEIAAEMRICANSIADLMTHHIDQREPAAPAEEPRETRAALQLYNHVMRSADAIRDAEVSLGLSDKANTKPHNLMRDMRQWVEKERGILAGEVVVAETSQRNGKHKRPHLLTEATG